MIKKKKKKTFDVKSLLSENHATYEIMWKNMVRPQMTIWYGTEKK